MKRNASVWVFLGILLSTSVARAEDPALKLFNVSGTQYSLLSESTWKRATQSANFFSCVRRLYTKPQLLEHPLPEAQYEILQVFRNKLTSDRGNAFAFLNSTATPWKCESKHGYCMGITALARDLNLLLIYDPKQSLGKLPDFRNDGEKSEYFENLLFDVWAKKKPVVIPGYSDLHTFSSDPVIRNIFMGAIPATWGDLATIPRVATDVFLPVGTKMKEEEIRVQVAALTTGHKKGYNPIMYVGSEIDAKRVSTASKLGVPDPRNLYIHVVQVTQVEELGPRKWRILVIDPNGHAPRNVGTLSVDLDATPSMQFKGASASIDVNIFGPLPGDVEHMDEIVSNLNAYAEKYPNIFVEH